MNDNDVSRIADVAGAVMAALQPLTAEERARVIQAAAALFGVGLTTPQAQHPTAAASVTDIEQAGARPGHASQSAKPFSLVELIQEKNPATNAQRIACFAYYREQFEGQGNFSRLDLAAYFPKAKLPAPGPNYARDYNNAVKEAWIHDDDAKSYLTKKGEEAVIAGFGGKRKSRTPAKKRRAGKSE